MMKICYVGTSLYVFCSIALVIASSLPWLPNAQVMSLAPDLHSWLHLLFSDPPEQGCNGCSTGKEETGTFESKSRASSRKMMKHVERGTELCRFYACCSHVSMPESQPTWFSEGKEFSGLRQLHCDQMQHLTQSKCKNLSLS